MSFLLVLTLALPPIAFGALQDVRTPSAAPVVTVEPACAEWIPGATPGQPIVPPHIIIGYNPRSPAARLASAQSLTLILSTGAGSRFNSTTFPMTLAAGGTWRADFTPKRNYIPGYSIFFFEDEKGRVDNNRAQYWDILDCRNGEPEESAVLAQASTYEGWLLAPGIQRPPDLARALDILKTDLKGHSTRYNYYNWIWRYELRLAGESPSKYEQVGGELDAFISTHGNEPDALRAAVLFVEVEQQKLPARFVQRLRDAVTALPQTAELVQHDGTGRTYHVSRDDTYRAGRLLTGLERQVTNTLADLDYWSVHLEQADLQKKASDYLAFATKYPGSPRIGEAYGGVFECKKELNDIAGSEAAFEKWAAFDPVDPFPLLAMAEYYVAQKTKP